MTYTPGLESGDMLDTFQYIVDDNRGRTSNVATVTIWPDAASRSACFSTPNGQPMTGQLPASRGPVLYRLVEGAYNGTVIFTDPTAGRFKYTPHHPSRGGMDTFTYTVTDSAGTERHTANIIHRSRVMVLGGAVSAGVMDSAKQSPQPAQRTGYRQSLYELLADQGYDIDFVGSRAFGYGIEGFDPHIEAHPGWTAGELAYGHRRDGTDGVYGWLDAEPAEVVLLHIDAEQVGDGLAGVEAILDEIDRWEASPGGRPVTVIMAGSPARHAAALQATAFNQAGLRALAASRAHDPLKAGRVIVISLDPVLNDSGDFYTGRYPNEKGYGELARIWYQALVESGALNRCP